jgi:hypothetical protein
MFYHIIHILPYFVLKLKKNPSVFHVFHSLHMKDSEICCHQSQKGKAADIKSEVHVYENHSLIVPCYVICGVMLQSCNRQSTVPYIRNVTSLTQRLWVEIKKLGFGYDDLMFYIVWNLLLVQHLMQTCYTYVTEFSKYMKNFYETVGFFVPVDFV